MCVCVCVWNVSSSCLVGSTGEHHASQAPISAGATMAAPARSCAPLRLLFPSDTIAGGGRRTGEFNNNTSPSCQGFAKAWTLTQRVQYTLTAGDHEPGRGKVNKVKPSYCMLHWPGQLCLPLSNCLWMKDGVGSPDQMLPGAAPCAAWVKCSQWSHWFHNQEGEMGQMVWGKETAFYFE